MQKEIEPVANLNSLSQYLIQLLTTKYIPISTLRLINRYYKHALEGL